MAIVCQVSEEAGIVGAFREAYLGQDNNGIVIETSRSLFCPVGCFSKACDFSCMGKTFRYIDINYVLYGGVEVGVGQVELDELVLTEG